MKGPLVVSLEVFIKLWKAGLRDFLFAVTADEEIGGFNGGSFLAKKLNKTKLAIIPDSSSGEDLVICQKAPFHIKIFDNKGRAVHGSKPWEGINSAEKVGKCCLEIVQKINKNHPDKTSAAITQIHSGSAINTIPNEAFSTIDVRISRLKEIPQIFALIEKITKANNCLWEKIDEPLIFEMSPNNVFLKKWVNIFQKATGRKPKLVTESGASDARFFHKAGVPAIITSVIGGGAHSEKEWASLKSLKSLEKIMFEFCKSISPKMC
jgi:acetylornithine deacetylase/succinyl-diaminopimelate desuccinylase-like protein